MSLEKLIIPFKEVDNELHRQYEKLGKYLDDKGPKVRYMAATASNFLGQPGIHSLGNIYLLFHAVDMSMNFISLGVGDKMKEQIDEGGAVANPYTYYPLKLFEIVRSPALGLGLVYLGKGSYEILDSTLNKTSISPESINDFLNGIYFVATASSMFLKDKDPKVLDEDSIFSKLKNSVYELTNAPKPIHNS